MPDYAGVLHDALELDEADREMLLIEIGLSFHDRERPTQAEFIANLREVSAFADAHPETVLDWADAEREIFGDPTGA